LVMTVATPLDITINLFQEDLDTEFNDIVEYQLDIIIPKSPNGSTYLMPEGFMIILFFVLSAFQPVTCPCFGSPGGTWKTNEEELSGDTLYICVFSSATPILS